MFPSSRNHIVAVWMVLRCATLDDWGSGHWSIVEWMSHFPMLEELFLYLSSSFKDLLISFKYFYYFSVAETNKVLFEWYWGVSPRAGCFGTFRCSKMQLPFLSFWSLSLFSNSFDFLTDFWYLWDIRTILVICN